MERLDPGAELGPYRVDGVLGAGGMGRVYRATDTRLHRPVAIKTSDERFGERFEREARAIASLTHAHVCTLYDVGPDYLVMELIEGDTLHQRLARGPLPLDEALEIARQIAEALEAAHEKGILHRDLKPANVMITSDGTVKVLDFGLAKAAPRADEEQATLAADLTRGVLLGTSGYMAPEQIEGKPADERADIWAFGVVLYEMLAGRRPFGDAAGNGTLVDVLTREVDYAPIPPKVQPLLRRCLARDPRRRLRAIGDFRLWLEDAPAREPGGAAPAPRWSWRVAASALAIAAIFAAAALYQWPRAPSPAAEPVRMAVDLPPGIEVTHGIGFTAGSLAFSPDGRTLVVSGTDEDGRQQLYARPLDSFEAVPIPGTAGGSGPFFSPDGASLGFFAEGRLKRVSLSGGVAVDIAPVPGFPSGASWSPDGRIAFVAGAQSWLHVVGSGGGPVETLVALAAGEGGHFRPEFLPDGRTLLFDSAQHVYAVDLTSGRRARLTEGIAARYAPNGHVVFARESALLSAPFDPQGLMLTAAPDPLVDGIAYGAGGTAGAHLAISREGHLAYLAGTSPLELVYRDADGTEHLITQPRPDFQNPRFSPDGRRLAVAVGQRPGEGVPSADLWIHDLETGVPTRFTFDRGRAPVWTPDGTALTYSHLPASAGAGRQGIYTKRADGRGAAELLIAIDDFHWLVGWTPDGRTLAYGRMEGAAADGTTRSSIIALTEGRTRHVVQPGSIWGGRLSPDGRWLAYYILEAGRYDVYVTPFPEGGDRWLISDQGGRDPSWAPDGTEIYYHFAGRLMAARVDTTSGVRVVSRRLVLEPFTPPHYDDYHVHPDGDALAYVRAAAGGREVRVVLNWLSELQERIER